MSKSNNLNRYQALIERVFKTHWSEGIKEFIFLREELDRAAQYLNLASVKNIGDVTYSFRFRTSFPESIKETEPDGLEWAIEGAGKGRYRFKLVKKTRIIPDEDLPKIAIPESTPTIIRQYALDDEQALLAIVRYNRLIDVFLSLTTYSLQNHLRTYVEGIGQIEIDELYIGMDSHGQHYVIPVQAKGGRDQLAMVQVSQDITWAAIKFPELRCKAISAQFMEDGVIALFEISVDQEEIKVIQERHYKLITTLE